MRLIDGSNEAKPSGPMHTYHQNMINISGEAKYAASTEFLALTMLLTISFMLAFTVRCHEKETVVVCSHSLYCKVEKGAWMAMLKWLHDTFTKFIIRLHFHTDLNKRAANSRGRKQNDDQRRTELIRRQCTMRLDAKWRSDRVRKYSPSSWSSPKWCILHNLDYKNR